MNTLVLPNFNQKEIVHLRYKNQNQHTQKKLLDFLVTKNISFSETHPKNFEAIIQIYNIQGNNKQKSLSKSPSNNQTLGKSPLKPSQKKIMDTPKKLTTSSPNLDNSEKKKLTKHKGDSSKQKFDEKKQETLKKKSISIHDSSKTKAKGNVFLEQLQKNLVTEQQEKEKRDSRISTKEKTKKGGIEEERKLSQENITIKETSETKKKNSIKNDSSMKILQKNKKILDNLINAHSILEFEANKHRSVLVLDKNKENRGDDEKKILISQKITESQENDSTLHEKNTNNLNKNQRISKNDLKGSFSKIGSKTKMSISQDKTKENAGNRKISEKLENNFKDIVVKEFSRVPSGEKLNKNSINLQFQKAVQILYERLDLLSSEELIFYYKFIVSKAKKLYLDFLQKRGLIVN